ILIIAVTNQKGGVGKTTSVFNIAAGLALMGKSVLLVDTDPQGHSTVSCLVDAAELQYSLYDAMTDAKVMIDQVIVPSTVPGLDIINSRISMAKLEPMLVGEIDGHFRLRDVLDPVKKKYDFIFLDTPPTLGLITINALVAADRILIPIQASYLSLEGTDDLLETIEKIRKIANSKLSIIGVIITLYDKRTNISKDVVLQIKAVFGESVFETFVSKSVKLEESPAYKESIFTYAPNSIGAVQYQEIAEEILKRAKK
ncbi:MAG: ParA family protein, partial [Methanosarcinaceae archaeon]|nr:ParA family protein [Methanosarcinaceae archaeon]